MKVTLTRLRPDADAPSAVIAGAADTNDTIFASPEWAAACAETWSPRAEVEVATIADAPPARMLLGRRSLRRHAIRRVRAVGLNATLDDDLDEPTIEFNGFFGGDDSRFPEHIEALFARLADDRDWQEIHAYRFSAARAKALDRLASQFGWRVRVAGSYPEYRVDLDHVREVFGAEYLRALSSNTRQQLRRAARGLCTWAGGKPLGIEAARSADEALQWLAELARLHRLRWAGTGARRSGFDIPAFRAFHERLVLGTASTGKLQMLRFSAGTRPLAYLYNVRTDGRTQFLMIGADYAETERFKVGMLAHQWAIERSLLEGARSYDFLGGNQRYKASMSTHRGMLVSLVIWRPSPALRVEHALREMRRRIAGTVSSRYRDSDYRSELELLRPAAERGAPAQEQRS